MRRVWLKKQYESEITHFILNKADQGTINSLKFIPYILTTVLLGFSIWQHPFVDNILFSTNNFNVYAHYIFFPVVIIMSFFVMNFTMKEIKNTAIKEYLLLKYGEKSIAKCLLVKKIDDKNLRTYELNIEIKGKFCTYKKTFSKQDNNFENIGKYEEINVMHNPMDPTDLIVVFDS